MLRLWPLAFILFPALELYVLILVGSEIGALATIGLVFLSMMAGLALLKARGAHLLARFQEGAAQGRIPPNPVFDTLCLMAAGWLFIFPGFVSDAIALALLLPVTRQGLVYLLKRFMASHGFAGTVHTQTAYRDSEGNVTWTCTTVNDPPPQSGRLSGGYAGEGRRNPGQVIIDCDVEETSPEDASEGSSVESSAGDAASGSGGPDTDSSGRTSGNPAPRG